MKRWTDIKAKPGIRARILNGEEPSLTWPGDEPCPVAKGDEVAILIRRMPEHQDEFIVNCGIVITKVSRTKDGKWIAEYDVEDGRQLYLGTSETYTRSRERTIDPDAPVIDPVAQQKYSEEARVKKATRRKDTPQSRRKRVAHYINEALAGKDELEELALLKRVEDVLVEEKNAAQVPA